MADGARSSSSPGRFGLTDPRAAETLRELGWRMDADTSSEVSRALRTLSTSADPDLALRGLERLSEALGADWSELDSVLRSDARAAQRLFGLLGASTALSDHLVLNPQRWRTLVGVPDRPKDIDTMTAELMTAVAATPDEVPGGFRAALEGAQAIGALRRAYRDLLSEIAVVDLSPGTVPSPAERYEEVAAALSDLAVAALRAALAVAVAEVLPPSLPGAPRGRFAVVAMGKCGAEELNYVSDVDVLFVASVPEPAEEHAASQSSSTPAQASSEELDEVGYLRQSTSLAAGLMRIAGEACFQVDAALRPEGRAGALVRTLDGYLAYYRRWARTWEFQALLKARAVAGDGELGAEYVAAVKPFVWSAAEREGFVTDVQAMRRRVEDHVPQELAERELKLGRGGLRDVEFAVQLLQLVHGRSDELLRSVGTIAALDELGGGGYVGRTDAAELSESYRFLRVLEHRLQLHRMLRTHVFPAPDDTAGLRRLARAAGLVPDGRRDPGRILLDEFRRHGGRVRRLHEKLFYRPLLEAVAGVPVEALRLTARSATDRLAALGFTSPQGALRHIGALTSGVSRRAHIQQALLPMLLDLFADTPDPDHALLAYRQVSEALTDTPWYLRVLRDQAPVAERLALLLGSSRMVPDLLVRAPEVLRMLGDQSGLVDRDPEQVAVSLGRAVARHEDPTQAVIAARSLRRHELLRVACADLLGLMELPEVCRALSRVWAAVLEAALGAATRSVLRSVEGGRAPATIALIGMGRLGGEELGYGSDADVLIVCEPAAEVPDAVATRYATSVAELLSRLLNKPSVDPPLQVDTELRPEGRSGPLVRTLESYRTYYRQWVQPWEAQALLRARPIAGDAELGRRFIEMIDPIRYPAGGLGENDQREIRRIKARVETERLPRGADATTNTKLGRGGLADVEWTVQLLQLVHAHEVAGLRTTATLSALDAAVAAGLLAEADAELLRAGWRMAARARNATTLVRGKPSDQIPGSGHELASVARVMGLDAAGEPGEFVDEYRRITRRARAVVDRIFYEE
ncbi:bifunctional [glutamine synthetase] adenylyltransferase/[glutamine synthetase]-adenylyl-L-tyrosine phosphorylase [Actinoalloteichus hymeniacidonis]|uniref:Bifunctional glutamine synthetase adenylyltransferase/adenylyl-removing enzyme n=1 Tax=Actinoalloteichus hymeniacidonis TaxID=340345 RepID=A0AAC9N0S3_9PSEU|nr:bifunctional [glutamine synthetase] adenylyltransferase/[glutamine synthetase]-adenylyl-L-tyrosine phosphorylase [Actinoalloteichus hymeniacidonis]AOS65176.1 glutamine synthetase adenylyltransferase [Actinoalloteichus hymeniacidonis]MBB5906744.1 glutamate-ammonia-ligase adenylyltransferase [Actinoalloteichus hymeniacidonis]